MMSGTDPRRGGVSPDNKSSDDFFSARNRFILGLIAASTFIILAIDLSTPLGLGVSLLYIVPILLSTLLSRVKLTFGLCLILTALVGIGFFLKPVSEPIGVPVAVANRSIIIVAIWFTAELSSMAKQTTESKRLSQALRREAGERERAQHELADQKERLAITLASIGDGVIATDYGGRVVLMNRVAEELTGWDGGSGVGRDVDEVFVLVEAKEGKRLPSLPGQVLASGQPVQMPGHVRLRGREGHEFPVADSAAPVKDDQGRVAGAVLVFRDVSADLKSMETLQRAGRLDSIGLLAGGIAHDFNNILTVVRGKIAVARFKMKDHPDIEAVLGEADRAAEKGKVLTRQLLTFARGGEPIKKVVPLRDVIVDAAQFALSGANVSPNFQIADDLWAAEVDEGQIGQAIQNIVINAKEAMPCGGTVDIAALNVEEDPPGDPEPPKMVRIEVRDRGVGIPEEHMARIFDPYFSTKQDGGRGLGLPIAYSVVQRHGGTLMVESKVGVGTSVTICLPSTGQAASPSEASSGIASSGGTGRILWMDDEPGVLEVGKEILTFLGYEVECAKDGVEAMQVYCQAKKAGRPFDLAILDLTIPGGMGGVETIRELKEYDPEAKAVVCSGYSNSPAMANFRENGFDGVLQKPYTVNELASLVKMVIEV